MEIHQKSLILALFLSSCILVAAAADNDTTSTETFSDSLSEIQKTRRALSVFNVIKFPNDPCTPSSGSKNGTCYTASECSNKKGTATGTCANSFGVCCIFTITCGGTISENNTFFDSSTTVATGTCFATICEINPNVCSLRLDFSTFVITGPSTLTTSALHITTGQLTSLAAGLKATLATECLTDTFSVTGTGAGTPPVICGTNTGQHMYIDSSTACTKLAFQLGPNAFGAAIPTRSWSIKVTQITCDSQLLPPPGCTQWFYGSTSGIVTTYNFVAGSKTNFHLANQNQVICFRRERSTCRICYTTVTASTDFHISGVTAVGGAPPGTMGFTKASRCCGYYGDAAIATVKGFDCLLIPGASKLTTAGNTAVPAANQFCGHRLTIATGALTTSITVCSRQTPFQISFISDNFEYYTENLGLTVNTGFKLLYTLSGTSC